MDGHVCVRMRMFVYFRVCVHTLVRVHMYVCVCMRAHARTVERHRGAPACLNCTVKQVDAHYFRDVLKSAKAVYKKKGRRFNCVRLALP